MVPGPTRQELFEWANQHLEVMRQVARYGHQGPGRCMVQFIVETQPELTGTVILKSQKDLKRELDPRSPIGKASLTLLEVYDPKHDFVASITCDGQIVSLNLISLTGSIGFTETDATRLKRVPAAPNNFCN